MKRTWISAVAVAAIGFVLLSGCTSMQPVYSNTGQHVGYEERLDSGKTLTFLGDTMLNLVPFGSNVRAARNAAAYGTVLRTVGNATRQDGGY